jgi:hypothetical protein
MRDVVELIVPELVARGRYRQDFQAEATTGTLREQLLGAGPRLAANHAGRQVRIDHPPLKEVHAA